MAHSRILCWNYQMLSGLFCLSITCFSWKHKPLLLTWICRAKTSLHIMQQWTVLITGWIQHKGRPPCSVYNTLCWDAWTIQLTVILKSSQEICTCVQKKRNCFHTTLKLQAWKSQHKALFHFFSFLNKRIWSIHQSFTTIRLSQVWK